MKSSTYLISLLIRIKSHAGFKKYFINTSWLIVEKIIRMLVGLFVGVYVARYLGPNRFGLLNYATSFVGLFSALATLGLDSIVVRNIVQNIEERNKLLGTAFILKLVGGIVLFGVVAFAVQFTSSDDYTKTLIFIIAGGMILQSLNVVDLYFQSQILGRLSSMAGLWTLIASSIIKLVLIFFKASLIWFAISTVLETGILVLMLLFFYLKQNVSILNWRFKWSIAKGFLRDSWALILSGLVIMIYMRIDQIMIKEILGSEAVGNYAAAVRLSEAWYFVPMAITKSLFPAILNTKKVSEKLYYARLQKLYDLMVWMAIAIALPTTFLSNWIISMLYGNVYAGADNVLSIHIWAGVFVFLGVSSGNWLVAENMQKIAFYRTFCGAICNIMLNIFMIPQYGISGAALSTLISQSIAAYFYDILNHKTRRTFWMKTSSFNILKKANRYV